MQFIKQHPYLRTVIPVFSAAFVPFIAFRLIKGGFYYPSLLRTLGGHLFWIFVVFILRVLTIFLSTPGRASIVESMGQELVKIGHKSEELANDVKETEFLLDGLNSVMGRYYSSTRRGYVGWMPQKARKGDELWVFHDRLLPFLLRPDEDQQGDERAYRLIEDGYIHGLMRVKQVHGSMQRRSGVN